MYVLLIVPSIPSHTKKPGTNLREAARAFSASAPSQHFLIFIRRPAKMKRCASDMSEDDSTGNVVPPDGGGKKAVSCDFRRAGKRFADTMVISSISSYGKE